MAAVSAMDVGEQLAPLLIRDAAQRHSIGTVAVEVAVPRFIEHRLARHALGLGVNLHYCRMVQTRDYNERPFDETVCDALIANRVLKTVKKIQNICGGGDIKHYSDYSCVYDAWHTVNPEELFAMSQNNRNGQPYQGVCNIRHTVQSDELFAMIEMNTNNSM